MAARDPSVCEGAICRHLAQLSSDRFRALQPDLMELVLGAAGTAEERVVLDEASDGVELHGVPEGLITVVPVDSSRSRQPGNAHTHTHRLF